MKILNSRSRMGYHAGACAWCTRRVIGTSETGFIRFCCSPSWAREGGGSNAACNLSTPLSEVDDSECSAEFACRCGDSIRCMIAAFDAGRAGVHDDARTVSMSPPLLFLDGGGIVVDRCPLEAPMSSHESVPFSTGSFVGNDSSPLSHEW